MTSPRRRRWLPIALTVLLFATSGCMANGHKATPSVEEASFDDASLWESLPRPADAQAVEMAERSNRGFTTAMIEPEMFDFYATRLARQGWEQQAPTEAAVTLPHQVWRKGDVELRIEIRGLDELGRTIVWLQLETD